MRLASLILFLFVSHDALSQIRPFQTTRLHSTAGAGIASMLVSESAVLNPAPLAFFADTFVSYQNTKTSLRSESPDRASEGREFSNTNRHEGYFLFDNSSLLKGGFSYQHQNENGFSRKRGTVTMASVISPELSFGLIYKYTDDYRPSWYGSHHKISHPVTLGLTWIPSGDLTFGAVWDDPGRATAGESRALLGVQYGITQDLIFIADAGGDPTGDYFDSRIWRAALQFNVFSDFYVRGGRYQDRSLNLEGNAWGVSWTGPKLGLDFAMRESKQVFKESRYLFPNEKLTEISFAGNIRF